MNKKAFGSIDTIGMLVLLVWASSVNIKIGLAAVAYFALTNLIKIYFAKE